MREISSCSVARVRASRARERFIQQQNLRVHRQGAGHAKRAAACRRKVRSGCLSRAGVRLTIAMYFSMCCCFLAGAQFGKHLVDREANIFVDRQPGQQRVILEDDAAIRTGLGDFQIIQRDRAAVGPDQSGDQRDQRGLARAGVADDGDELAFLDLQIDVRAAPRCDCRCCSR